MEIRRAYSIVFFWEDNELVVTNYLTDNKVTCNLYLLQVLGELNDFVSDATILNKFSGVPGFSQILAALVKQNIILKKGSAREKKDSQLKQTWKWGSDAQFFHFATRQVNYSFNFDEIREILEKKALIDPPPSPFKTQITKSKIPLLKTKFRKKDFWETLFSRRTSRSFIDKAIPEQVFANLLTAVSGMTRFYNTSALDRRLIKTSPSGGARHPIEVYPIINNVQHIPRGIYHYEVETNSLVLVHEYPGKKILNRLFSGQIWVGDAAAAFIFTGVVGRTMWKYDHSRAYRVMLLDAGHLGQTFHLTGTSLGLGVFTTAAIQDKQVEKILNIDGITEIVLYAGCTGYTQ